MFVSCFLVQRSPRKDGASEASRGSDRVELQRDWDRREGGREGRSVHLEREKLPLAWRLGLRCLVQLRLKSSKINKQEYWYLRNLDFLFLWFFRIVIFPVWGGNFCWFLQVAQVLLTLPYSFSQLGMLSGILLQLFYGIVGSWTAYLISVLYVEYRTRKEKENVSFKNHVIQVHTFACFSPESISHFPLPLMWTKEKKKLESLEYGFPFFPPFYLLGKCPL